MSYPSSTVVVYQFWVGVKNDVVVPWEGKIYLNSCVSTFLLAIYEKSFISVRRFFNQFRTDPYIQFTYVL